MIGLDLTRAVRTPAERLALVEAILNASTQEMELDWIEWKSHYDLLKAEPQFEIARHLLGFANRDPDLASSTLGGCACLVIGVEPGSLPGIQSIDPAQLGKAIDQYTGGTAGPRWSPDYVECQGRTVLVITVEPPEWGDSIHTLKRGGRLMPGTIFIRRRGETEQANPAEVLMLQERASRRTARIAIGLRWASDAPEILAAGATDDEIDAWVAREREDLAVPVRDRGQGTSGSTVPALPAFQLFADTRKPEEVQGEVEKYLVAAPPLMRNRVLGTAALRSQPMVAVLLNHTETNFSEVRCELRVDEPVWSMVDARDARDLVDPFPHRPRRYGTSSLASLLSVPTYIPSFAPPRCYRGFADNSGSSRIVFDPVNLRPRAAVSLEPFVMVAQPELLGRTVEVRWTATATNADGVAAGALQVSVSRKVFGIADLSNAAASKGGSEDTG